MMLEYFFLLFLLGDSWLFRLPLLGFGDIVWYIRHRILGRDSRSILLSGM